MDFLKQIKQFRAFETTVILFVAFLLILTVWSHVSDPKPIEFYLFFVFLFLYQWLWSKIPKYDHAADDSSGKFFYRLNDFDYWFAGYAFLTFTLFDLIFNVEQQFVWGEGAETYALVYLLVLTVFYLFKRRQQLRGKPRLILSAAQICEFSSGKRTVIETQAIQSIRQQIDRLSGQSTIMIEYQHEGIGYTHMIDLRLWQNAESLKTELLRIKPERSSH